MGIVGKIKKKIIGSSLERAVNKKNNADFFFIQIGACDGVAYDPVYELVKKHDWQGILVEPVPHYFQLLKENYSWSSKVRFLNKAVSNKAGTSTFYTIDPAGMDELPPWVKGISSLSKEKNALSESYWQSERGRIHVEKGYSYEKFKEYIREIEVDCITVDQLLESENVRKIDLLQIDAEGYDYIILKQFDLSKIKPAIIHFEFNNLSDSEKEECKNWLQDNGYDLNLYNGNDMLATLSMD